MHRAGDSPVHRLPAQVKLVSLFAFVVLVVLTPREQIWAFFAYAAVLAAVIAIAQIPFLWVLRRLVVEIPFIFFAVLLPFIAKGPQVEVLGLSLSIDGLWGAWNILAKGTLGVAASIILATTTEPRALLMGLEQLRLPPVLVHIATFMLRYMEVVQGEMKRMHIARESRGFHARHLGHARVLAQSAGALFIRTYERGERVHLAMLSRGFSGSMPRLGDAAAARSDWAVASVLPGAALLIAAAAWMMSP